MATSDLATRKQQPHVVAVPLPAQGHLNPLMRFCKLLASHGFLVTFVNIDPVHHRLEELVPGQGEEEASHGKPSTLHEEISVPEAAISQLAGNVRKAHIPVDGLDLTSDFRVSFELFFEALLSIAPPLELLIRSLNQQGPSVTCIVSDIGMTLPTQNVADKLSIPRIAFVPCSASLILLCHHVLEGKNISTSKVMEALTRRAERGEVVGDGLTGLPTLYNNDLPCYKHVVDDTRYMWEFTTKVCQATFLRDCAMVMNSFEDIEGPALMALSKHLSLPVYGVGPLVEPLHKESSTSLWREDEACIHWLDQQPRLSVLYISFGSISILSQAQIEEIVAGLVSSQQRFLWVFRPDLVQNVETYSSTLASDIPSRSHGKGYVVNWAPQLAVLAHPSVGGFLTHCGWNSVTEAIANGVPMICWPYFADQFLDAKYVVEVWKVGLQFAAICAEGRTTGTGVEVERGEVERVIKAVMEGEEGRALRNNVLRLKEAGSQSLQPGGTSHNNLQALFTHIIRLAHEGTILV